MSEESTLWQVALLDRGESLVVMGRKKYDELYALAQNLTKERDEAQAEVERLRKLLNPDSKLDLGATLMRLMREDQRKAIYAQAWEEAILAGNTREQAHSIARAAAEAALKEKQP